MTAPSWFFVNGEAEISPGKVDRIVLSPKGIDISLHQGHRITIDRTWVYAELLDEIPCPGCGEA